MTNSDLQVCPFCGDKRINVWLTGPDRFHGRQEIYNLMRCESCSLVWLRNPPHLEDMGRHYGPDYRRMVEGAAEGSPERWTPCVRTLETFKQGGSLLDLGCSSGAFLGALSADRWTRYGVEISGEAAARAKARTGAEVFVGDVLTAPFKSGSFDAITCFDVLEHMHNPREVIAKVQEWLKPGGVFYTLVPNIDSIEAGLFRSYWYGLELPRHLYHFSPTSLGWLARSVGLTPVSLKTVRNPLVEYSLKYCCDGLLNAIGMPRSPLSISRRRSFIGRCVRKVFRLTAVQTFSAITCRLGAGQAIQGILAK